MKNNKIKGKWRRSEVSKLSGLSVSQLHTLQKHGILNPERDGGLWMFSWEELLLTRAIKRLRADVGFSKIKQVAEYLASENGLISQHNRLIASEGDVFWIPDTPEAIREILIKITGKGQGQITASFAVADLVADLWEVGPNRVAHFEERAERPANLAA